HGGGYFSCSPRTHRPITWRLSAAARRPVLALDYRQGPVHKLADSLSDALDAYHCLLERGYEPEDMIVAGDSAGGHLTLATLLALRDRGLGLPSAAVCLSPWTDLTDFPRRANRWQDPMLPAGRVRWLARRWTDGLDPRDPLVSPVLGDFTGLPPLMIVTGSTELLRDEARRVAERARTSGVPVTYEEWPRMPHVFPILADVLPEARLAFRHMSLALAAVAGRDEAPAEDEAVAGAAPADQEPGHPRPPHQQLVAGEDHGERDHDDRRVPRPARRVPADDHIGDADHDRLVEDVDRQHGLLQVGADPPLPAACAPLAARPAAVGQPEDGHDPAPARRPVERPPGRRQRRQVEERVRPRRLPGHQENRQPGPDQRHAQHRRDRRVRPHRLTQPVVGRQREPVQEEQQVGPPVPAAEPLLQAEQRA